MNKNIKYVFEAFGIIINAHNFAKNFGLVTKNIEIGLSRRCGALKSDFITVHFLIFTSQPNLYGLKSRSLELANLTLSLLLIWI